MKDPVQANGNNRRLAATIFYSGLGSVFFGIAGLVAWFSGYSIISSFLPQYVPMSPSAAIMFLLSGLLFVFLSEIPSWRISKNLVTGIAFFLTLIGLSEFSSIVVFSGSFVLDDLIFPVFGHLSQIHSNRISPVTGFIFVVCSAGILVRLFPGHARKADNVISLLGIVVLFAGFVTSLGYLFGSPFLYGGNVRPVAALVTIGFLFLGSGLIAMGGPDTVILKVVSGPSPRARILRYTLPLVILAILLDHVLNVVFIRFLPINLPLLLAIVTILLVLLSIFLLTHVTGIIFHQAETAEEERKRAEEELKESEARYRSLTETAADAIIVIGSDGNIVLFNKAAERIFGYSAAEVVGSPVELIIPENLRASHQAGMKRYRATGQTFVLGKTVEITAKRRGGAIFPVELSLSEFKTGSNSTFVGIMRDITERREAEEKLRKYSEELQELIATRNKFFSIIGHDLKSPFTAISGYSELLSEDIGEFSTEEIRKMAGIIAETSKYALQLLGNLLAWANMQTGRIEFHPETLELKDLVDECAGFLRSAITHKNLVFSSEISSDCMINGDMNMIRTILRNLFSNAVKFSQPGGKVIVRSARSGEFVEISVTDEGVGIPRQNIPRLFRIDSKYSTPGTANEQGTGLGLILCREFVERHKGQLSVTSEPGSGSTFTFTIPAA